jgi:hypothetical protein
MTKRVAGAARLGTRMGQASADAYSIDNGPGVKKMDRYPEDQRQRREEGSERRRAPKLTRGYTREQEAGARNLWSQDVLRVAF